MNPANYREALTEMREDESEGADILLVGLVLFVSLCV
jgi:porphobilinogen synthase